MGRRGVRGLSACVTTHAAGQLVASDGPPLPLAPIENRGRAGTEAKGTLVEIPAVQKELALTPAQKSGIREARKEGIRSEQATWEGYQDLFRALGPRPEPGAMAEFNRSAQEALNDVGRRTEVAMLKILDHRHAVRLDQIHLQVEGPVSFCRAEVQKGLRLDPKQVRTIEAVVAHGIQRMVDSVSAVAASVRAPAGPYTPELSRTVYESKPYQDAFRKQGQIVRKARDDTLKAVTELMSKDQQKAYAAMLGKPFDLTYLRSKMSTP